MPRLELTRHRIQAQGLGCVKECYQKGARDETWCAQTTSCLLLLPRLPSLRRAHRLVPRLHPGFSDVQDIPSLFNVIEELETALSLGSKSGSTRNKSGSGWTTTRRRPDFPRVNETSDRVTVELACSFCRFFLMALIAGRCTAYLALFTSNFTTSPHLTRAHILSYTITRNANRSRQCVSASHRGSGHVYEGR